MLKMMQQSLRCHKSEKLLLILDLLSPTLRYTLYCIKAFIFSIHYWSEFKKILFINATNLGQISAVLSTRVLLLRSGISQRSNLAQWKFYDIVNQTERIYIWI